MNEEFDKLKENVKIEDDLIKLMEYYIGDIYSISRKDNEGFLKFKGQVELLKFLKELNNR